MDRYSYAHESLDTQGYLKRHFINVDCHSPDTLLKVHLDKFDYLLNYESFHYTALL